jgi:hypothetical protein
MEYDSLFWVLGAGLAISLVMTISKRLANSTRRRTGLLFLVYGVLLLVFYSRSFCAGISDILSGYVYVSCQRVLAVRHDLAYNWIGTEPVGFLSSLSGIVGFTIAFSGTKSGKWRGLAAVLLAFFILAFVGRFILPVFSPATP